MTDRVEQGQPELLGVVLIALHLHEGEPVRLARRPAQARSSDVFPLPAGAEMIVTFSRRRAVQGSEKITPVDQPGSCWSHRQRPALISTPDTPGAGPQSRHLLPRYQASTRTVNGAPPR